MQVTVGECHPTKKFSACLEPFKAYFESVPFCPKARDALIMRVLDVCFEDMNGTGRYYITKHCKCPRRVAYSLPMSSGYSGST